MPTETLLRTTEWKLAREPAPTAQETALAVYVSTLPASAFKVEGFRGVRIRFICNDGANNNGTATATIYAIDGCRNSYVNQTNGYTVDSLGTVAITFSNNSAMAGIDGTYIDKSFFFADTLGAWAPTTPGTARLTFVGGNAASYSGTADTNAAELLYSDLGAIQYLAIVFTTYSLTAAASKINALVQCIV